MYSSNNCKNQQKKLLIKINLITWRKDSHSLFDYESNKVTKNAFSFPDDTKIINIYRQKQSISIHGATQALAADQRKIKNLDDDHIQFLTKFKIQSLRPDQLRFTFGNEIQKHLNQDKPEGNEKKEDPFFVLSTNKDDQGVLKGYRLQPGQIIKIGRSQFFVREIRIGSNVTSANQKNRSFKSPIKFSPKFLKQEHQIACKICLEQNESPNNFLINPCKCSGSCGTVHINCLTQWMSIKVKKQVFGGTLHYNFQKFECQVCKGELPTTIKREDNKIIEIVPIEKPKEDYLILQGACERTKSIMVIRNAQGGIKLGRGTDCQIKIDDISVSRFHALIKYQKNGFMIFDNKSKFGTLIRQNEMAIDVGLKMEKGVQIGRTLVMLHVVSMK